MKKDFLKVFTGIILISLGLIFAGCGGEVQSFDKKDDTVKVGLLHSLSGTMSLSEVPVRDAEKLAIEEINANGGVLGKKLKLWKRTENQTQMFLRKERKNY